MRPQTTCVSATPGPWEINESGGVFTEQVIRPTGLIDPPVDIRPARAQVDDLVGEVRQVAQAGYRALVTVLTERQSLTVVTSSDPSHIAKGKEITGAEYCTPLVEFHGQMRELAPG